MKNKTTFYNKQHDVSALSLTTHETLKINPQISHTHLLDSEGNHKGPDKLILFFSAANPCPAEAREDWKVDPNEPLVVSLESKDQVDHLIAVLQQLRFQIYGPDLSFDNNKN